MPNQSEENPVRTIVSHTTKHHVAALKMGKFVGYTKSWHAKWFQKIASLTANHRVAPQRTPASSVKIPKQKLPKGRRDKHLRLEDFLQEEE